MVTLLIIVGNYFILFTIIIIIIVIICSINWYDKDLAANMMSVFFKEKVWELWWNMN